MSRNHVGAVLVLAGRGSGAAFLGPATPPATHVDRNTERCTNAASDRTIARIFHDCDVAARRRVGPWMMVCFGPKPSVWAVSWIIHTCPVVQVLSKCPPACCHLGRLGLFLSCDAFSLAPREVCIASLSVLLLQALLECDVILVVLAHAQPLRLQSRLRFGLIALGFDEIRFATVSGPRKDFAVRAKPHEPIECSLCNRAICVLNSNLFLPNIVSAYIDCRTVLIRVVVVIKISQGGESCLLHLLNLSCGHAPEYLARARSLACLRPTVRPHPQHIEKKRRDAQKHKNFGFS